MTSVPALAPIAPKAYHAKPWRKLPVFVSGCTANFWRGSALNPDRSPQGVRMVSILVPADARITEPRPCGYVENRMTWTHKGRRRIEMASRVLWLARHGKAGLALHAELGTTDPTGQKREALEEGIKDAMEKRRLRW
jgi:hypothetical protein